MRIVDFIEQYRQYNLMRRFPKGTKVVFNLPKDERFSLNKEKVDTGVGFIYSHDDTGYEIFYDNTFVHVGYEDVLVSQAELDRCPVCDSLINSVSFRKEDNFNEIAKKLAYSFQNIDSDATIDLLSAIQSVMGMVNDDQELQVLVFDEDPTKDEELVQSIDSFTSLGVFGGCYVFYSIISYI